MAALGIIDLSWNGKSIPIEKGASIMLAGYKQNPVIVGRTVDYAQEYAAGEVTATLKLARGQRLSDLLADGDGELQVICDTGQSFTMRAFLTDPPKATGGEGGKIERKWTFGAFEEILNG